MNEETLILHALGGIALPECVKRIELKFAPDATGVPSRWINLHIDDDQPSDAKIDRLGSLDQLGSVGAGVSYARAACAPTELCAVTIYDGCLSAPRRIIMTINQEHVRTSIGSDSKTGEGGGGAALSGGAGSPVFKPDTGRDAKGTGSHQSGEGGSGNESGPGDAEQADVDAREPTHPS